MQYIVLTHDNPAHAHTRTGFSKSTSCTEKKRRTRNENWTNSSPRTQRNGTSSTRCVVSLYLSTRDLGLVPHLRCRPWTLFYGLLVALLCRLLVPVSVASHASVVALARVSMSCITSESQLQTSGNWHELDWERLRIVVTSLLLLSTSTARVLVRHRTEMVGQSISDDLLPYILYGGI